MSSSVIGELGPFPKANRSAFVNFLRAKYEMYTGAVRVASRPYYVTLEPSDICQLRCPTCVTGIENETRRQKGELSIYRSDRTKLTTSLFDALLEELGPYLFLIVFYNFGEPLLNPRLPELIRKAKAFGIETDVNTNLSLPLSDRQIEDLLTSGLDYLFASIDGFTQESYQVHRVGGDVELAKKNLTRIVHARNALGLKTGITYNFLVFSFNEHEVPAAARFCADLGISFNTRNAFVHNPAWLPSYRKNEQPLPLPDEVALPPAFSHVENGTRMAWSPLPQIAKADSLPRCAWHYGYTAISAGGSITPCCAVPGEKNDFGRVVPGASTFADVWNNDHFEASRTAFADVQPEGGSGLETVCTQCPVPRFVHHMYSLHDFKVIGQFDKVFGDAEPVLRQAFDLVSQICYGQSIADLFPGGTFHPPAKLFGQEHKNPTALAEFVTFFEQHLMSEGHAAFPLGQEAVSTLTQPPRA